MKRHHERKSPPYFLYLIILILLFYSYYITNAYSNATDKLKYEEQKYYVRTDDTLWSIGERYKCDTDSVKEWISQVKEINNMEKSNLVEGTEITILVDKTSVKE